MTDHTAEISAEPLRCHLCRYDLRAHPRDGNCPECGASVEKSRRLAAIPCRPNWRDSDPRWRRRILAGMWVLVLLPLMAALEAFGWTLKISARSPLDYGRNVQTLDDTFLCGRDVYEPLVFCIGVVLLFSKERRPWRNRFDWTRRWGVLCSYVVLLLSAAEILFIFALVLNGIAGVFLSMPPRYQPGVTEWFVKTSTTYLRYGPHPKEISSIVLVAFSSITILLACVPLFDALRSSGPKWIAAVLIAPLAFFAIMHLVQAVRFPFGVSKTLAAEMNLYSLRVYFWPRVLMRSIAGLSTDWTVSGSPTAICLEEGAKWCIILTIAVWLSLAQLATGWQRKKLPAARFAGRWRSNCLPSLPEIVSIRRRFRVIVLRT